MRLSVAKVRRLARERGLSLASLLEHAGVSRTAFYALARRRSVFQRTIESVARTLEVQPMAILEPTTDEILERRLGRARRIAASDPKADFQNVWHSLALLELSPAERLERSLLRGATLDLHG